MVKLHCKKGHYITKYSKRNVTRNQDNKILKETSTADERNGIRINQGSMQQRLPLMITDDQNKYK